MNFGFSLSLSLVGFAVVGVFIEIPWSVTMPFGSPSPPTSSSPPPLTEWSGHAARWTLSLEDTNGRSLGNRPAAAPERDDFSPNHHPALH